MFSSVLPPSHRPSVHSPLFVPALLTQPLALSAQDSQFYPHIFGAVVTHVCLDPNMLRALRNCSGRRLRARGTSHLFDRLQIIVPLPDLYA